MRLFATVCLMFPAGHRLSGHSVCERQHGHTFYVTVKLEAPALKPRQHDVVDSGELQNAVAQTLNELSGEDLNDFLPGVSPSPTGLAMYIHEQLSLKYPNIVRVGVQEDPPYGFLAEVEWPLR